MLLPDFSIPPAFVETIGYVAAALVFLAFYTKAMLTLRYIAIAGNVAFILYGAFAQLNPVFFMHCILLPLNIIRLWQLRRMVADVTAAASDDFSIDWLLPHMERQRAKAGALLFREGDSADRMYYIVSGELGLPEVGAVRSAGDVIGEIGLFSPQRQRISSARCLSDCEFMTITDRKVLDLYYQNPEFGFFLLRLITGRLVHEVDRLKQAT